MPPAQLWKTWLWAPATKVGTARPGRKRGPWLSTRSVMRGRVKKNGNQQFDRHSSSSRRVRCKQRRRAAIGWLLRRRADLVPSSPPVPVRPLPPSLLLHSDDPLRRSGCLSGSCVRANSFWQRASGRRWTVLRLPWLRRHHGSKCCNCCSVSHGCCSSSGSGSGSICC